MSLFDRWRGKRDDDGAIPTDRVDPAADGGPARSDVIDFAPRSDGEYHCAEAGLYLRFIRPLVTETDATHDESATGEFTDSGRFTVARPFERAIVYTVLTDDGGTLVARRTDTETRSTDELSFDFRPDTAGLGG